MTKILASSYIVTVTFLDRLELSDKDLFTKWAVTVIAGSMTNLLYPFISILSSVRLMYNCIPRCSIRWHILSRFQKLSLTFSTNCCPKVYSNIHQCAFTHWWQLCYNAWCKPVATRSKAGVEPGILWSEGHCSFSAQPLILLKLAIW